MSSHFVEDSGGLPFVQIMIFLPELLLKECEILDNSCAITPVTVSHARHLDGVLDRLSLLNHIVSLDTVLADDTVQLGVARIGDHTHFDAILAVFGQLLSDLQVRSHLNFLTGQVVPHVGHFWLIDEEGDPTLIGATFRVEEHVGEEDRVVIDIGATHICHPGNVIESRDKERLVLCILKLLCNLGLLFL